MRIATLLVLCVSCAGFADDYPQWLGPRRDGIYREAGVIQTMPAGGLKLRWRAGIGGGYAGVAVWKGKVIVTDRQVDPANPRRRGSIPGSERIVCLDDGDGSTLWKVEYECLYSIDYPGGPRCTPTVDPATGRVYALGAEGHLYCIEIDTGKVAWNLKLDGPTPTWGFAGHPLIDGDRLIVLTSGKKALVTAFDKASGKVVWESEACSPPGYVPPQMQTVAEMKQLWAWSPKGLFALDPATGKTIWFVEHGPVKFGASCNFPARIGDRILMCSEFEGSSGATIAPDGKSARRTWVRTRQGGEMVTLHNLMSPLVVHEGLVFGTLNSGELTACDPADGRIVWKSAGPRSAGGDGPRPWSANFLTPWQPDEAAPPRHFFLANDSGDLILCRLSAKGYEEIGRTHLLEPTNQGARRPVLWCHPAYANRAIYWRNDKEVGSWSIAKE